MKIENVADFIHENNQNDHVKYIFAILSHIHTPRGNLGLTIHLLAYFLGGGRKRANPEETRADMGGTCIETHRHELRIEPGILELCVCILMFIN